jgi:hypothetical protein
MSCTHHDVAPLPGLVGRLSRRLRIVNYQQMKGVMMKRLALTAVGAAVIGLTACSHGKAPSAASAGHTTRTPIAPISCSHQYRAWNDGEGKGLMDALDTVASAGTAKNGRVLTSALKRARPAVAKAARHPIPACADPMGYWSVLLMHVNAAVGGKGSASSVRAAMQDVQEIQDKLVAEVKQSAR